MNDPQTADEMPTKIISFVGGAEHTRNHKCNTCCIIMTWNTVNKVIAEAISRDYNVAFLDMLHSYVSSGHEKVYNKVLAEAMSWDCRDQ